MEPHSKAAVARYKHRSAYLLHAEVTHGDSAPDDFETMDGVYQVRPGRSGSLPTSILGVLRVAVSPVTAIEGLREDLLGDVEPSEFFEPAPSIVRVGWIALDQISGQDRITLSWNWDTIEHDCSEHDVPVYGGLVIPDPSWDRDEYELSGCGPSGPRHRCRICGLYW